MSDTCIACGCDGFRLSLAGRCDGCEEDAALERAHWWNKGAEHERRVIERDLALLVAAEPSWPRFHLFRVPRRELVLVAGAVASGLLAGRYGLSPSEGTLVAGPLVAGWVASEVVGS